MRVFVTGATGFVGTAIVRELMNAGHEVIGLARSDTSAKALTDVGANVHRGDMEDLDRLQAAARNSEGVIHAAFDHDFANFAQKCEIDRLAIEAIGSALEGTDRPFIVTSGLPLVSGRPATEQDVQPSGDGATPRMSEQTAFALTKRGVRASVVRMSQAHDRDKQGFATYMLALAREKGISAYVGNGLNRWPAIHRKDAARLYRLALEKGAVGARYHAVTQEGIPVRKVAEAIGHGLNLPSVALSPEEAISHFGWLARPVSMDAPASSEFTQQALGWKLADTPGFLTDLQHSSHSNRIA